MEELQTSCGEMRVDALVLWFPWGTSCPKSRSRSLLFWGSGPTAVVAVPAAERERRRCPENEVLSFTHFLNAGGGGEVLARVGLKQAGGRAGRTFGAPQETGLGPN